MYLCFCSRGVKWFIKSLYNLLLFISTINTGDLFVCIKLVYMFNAVEADYFLFSGCLDIASAIDMNGLSYNYFDEMAQNYCAAKTDGWVFSIRRDCFGVAPTCNEMCATFLAPSEIKLPSTYSFIPYIYCITNISYLWVSRITDCRLQVSTLTSLRLFVFAIRMLCPLFNSV